MTHFAATPPTRSSMQAPGSELRAHPNDHAAPPQACRAPAPSGSNGLVSAWVICTTQNQGRARYVARRLWFSEDGIVPTEARHEGPTLAYVRAQLPEGLFCMPRKPGDAPELLETWF